MNEVIKGTPKKFGVIDLNAFDGQIIKELKEERQKFENHFEKRLADKREHIDTILLDKKWFRLASVFSVIALLGVFLFIEFATPGHGWFVFGN